MNNLSTCVGFPWMEIPQCACVRLLLLLVLIWSAAVWLPGIPRVPLRICDAWDKKAKQTEEEASFCITKPLPCPVDLSHYVLCVSDTGNKHRLVEKNGCRDAELLPSAAADSAVWESNCHPSVLARSQSNQGVCEPESSSRPITDFSGNNLTLHFNEITFFFLLD